MDAHCYINRVSKLDTKGRPVTGAAISRRTDMSKEKMMVFGYARVSTDNQLENYSIEEQTARLEAYCAAKGWTLLKTYVDGGFSGGNTDRPALQQMLKAVKDSAIDAVVVYKLDRLSRSQKDTLTLIEDDLLSNGTDFVSINENFDTSSPFGRAMIGILSVFAQLEKDQITERFTMGRIGRSKAGYFHGGGNAPTGYDYVAGELVVNEYEAMQVRQAYSLFLSGKSINSIMRTLDSQYTTRWTAAKVRNILKNSLYVGKVHFMGKEYDGEHQPIIDSATYAAVNDLLASSAREDSKTTAQKTPFRAGYLLSGLVYCGRCGARYSANHGYYKCYSRAKSSPKYVVDPDCYNDNWLIDELDGAIIGQIDALVSSADRLQAVVDNAAQRAVPAIDTESITIKLSEIDKQMSKLIDLYQVGTIPMEQVTERVNKLAAERKALQALIDLPAEQPAVDMFLRAAANYKQNFATAQTDARRLLVSSLIRRITIDGQSISITWRI